jgi:thiamine-phosphate pyrophosphorylase
MKNSQLRIIDANIDRLSEGLRVLEEIARMMLNDDFLTQKLKDIRHQITKITPELRMKLLSSRDASADIGSSMGVTVEERSQDVQGIIAANSKRVQESLRVLEEMAKIPELNLDSELYRGIRFELYAIEKVLVARILRKGKIERLKGIYAIIDTEWLKGRKPGDIASKMIKGGADVIQIRCKDRNSKEFLAIAIEVKEICEEKDVLFIINDSLEVALACTADGLHVGQKDLPVVALRKLMPIDMVLGCSVRTVNEAIDAQKDGADYLGVGSIFTTATKKTTQVVGTKRIKEIKKVVDIPIVAIGGINKENLNKVMKAGADAAAVISAIMGVEDIEGATRELVNIIGGGEVE